MCHEVDYLIAVDRPELVGGIVVRDVEFPDCSCDSGPVLDAEVVVGDPFTCPGISHIAVLRCCRRSLGLVEVELGAGVLQFL